MKFIKKYLFLILILFSLTFPSQVKAFSVQQAFTPISSLLISVGEKIQYVFAFTPTGKVKVLESQAQRRLTVAQSNTSEAENLIKEYQDIKSRQNTLLDKVDDATLKQVQEQTVVEQQTLAKIGNNQPDMAGTVKVVNTNVVGEIKNTITLKEGTTAGAAFEQSATIVYAPGTSGQGIGTHTYEGGALQMFAPGTSGTGTGGTTIEGGGSQFAPGTSGGSGTGGTTVEGSNPGVVGGSGQTGTGGTTVSGSNPGVVGGGSGGETGTQTVVGQ